MILMLLLVLFTVVGCGSNASEMEDDVEINENSDAEATVSEEETENGSEETFAWPDEIPKALRNFEDVVLTSAAKDTFTEQAWTIFFECSDKQVVLDYIESIENEGYLETSFSENNFGLDYSASGPEADVTINFVTGNLSKLYIAMTSGSSNVTPGGGAEWPVEFENWQIPIIKEAKVTLAENRSASGNVMTQGVNVVVVLSGVDKEAFEAYTKSLEKSDFVKNVEESMGDIMMSYNKQISGGDIEMLLVFSEDSTTITAYNSAAAAAKENEASGDLVWPENLKAVPEFTKGKYKETVNMGGDLIAITFLDTNDSDVDWYRNELKQSGFERQDDSDTEGYLKMENGYIYTVGFIQEGGTLQIIIMSAKL